MKKHWLTYVALSCIVMLHVLLLSYQSISNSPNFDEPGHLAAGLIIWQEKRFDVYHVNPPLVRVIASMPIHFFSKSFEWSDTSPEQSVERPEWKLGRLYVASQSSRWFDSFIIARLFCITFSLIGLLGVFLWCKEMWGEISGYCGALLYSVSPNLSAWAATISTDAAAASITLWTCYLFWRFIRERSRRNVILFACIFGRAIA